MSVLPLTFSTIVRGRIVEQADPTVNLEADQGDGFSVGFGLLHASNRVRPAEESWMEARSKQMRLGCKEKYYLGITQLSAMIRH